MPPIDAKFDGNPTEIGTLSSSLSTLSTSITDTWASELRSGHSTATDEWSGVSSASFDTAASSAETDLSGLSGNVNTFKKAVDSLKTELDSVKSTLETAISDATTYGLTVEGTTIKEPTKPACLGQATFDSNPQQVTVTAEEAKQVDDYNEKVTHYNTISDNVSKAREKEKKAHDDFQESCFGIVFPDIAAIAGGGKLALAKKLKGKIGSYLIDPLKYGGLGLMMAGGQLTKNASKAVTDIIHGTKAALNSKGFGFNFGRHVKGLEGEFNFFKNGKAMKGLTDPKNWEKLGEGGRHLAAGAASGAKKLHLDKAFEWGSKAGKYASKAGKFLGPVGTALSIGSVAYDAYKGGSEQWKHDSANPSLTRGDKVARTAAKGAWDAVPAAAEAAGSAAGSSALAAAFSWTGPGAAVAGAAGGYIGGKIGRWGGDLIHNTFDSTVSKAIDNWKPSEQIDSAKNWVSDKAKKLKFW